MSRIVAAARLRAVTARHRGDAVFCPVCERGFDAFKNDWNRIGALCWRCGSHERHRAQWLLFESRPRAARRRPVAAALLAGVVHLAAPDRRGRACATSRPTSTPSGVDLKLDVTELDLPDASFDAVLCSHVLEHVPDDARAMRELRRITAPRGFCLVMVPLALDRDAPTRTRRSPRPRTASASSCSTTTSASTPPTSPIA